MAQGLEMSQAFTFSNSFLLSYFKDNLDQTLQFIANLLPGDTLPTEQDDTLLLGVAEHCLVSWGDGTASSTPPVRLCTLPVQGDKRVTVP